MTTHYDHAGAVRKMTTAEKQANMATRNAEICAYYADGHKLSECASRFKLGRQRVLQILQAAGAWKPYVRTDRDQFLGVTVTKPTKDALFEEAERKGVSVSKLTSDILDARGRQA